MPYCISFPKDQVQVTKTAVWGLQGINTWGSFTVPKVVLFFHVYFIYAQVILESTLLFLPLPYSTSVRGV